MASLATRFSEHFRLAVTPRFKILRLLPIAGKGLVGTLLVINIVLGLMPVSFILANSALIGSVHAATGAGPSSPAWHTLALHFVFTAVSFLGMQVLTPVRDLLGSCLKRRVDGEVRDQTMGAVMTTTSIGPMEDRETLNALAEVTRHLDSGGDTPGAACAGMLALVAKYVQLIALIAIVGTLTSWMASVALGAMTMAFRYGQRGGLRKYSSIARELAGTLRRAAYLGDVAMGGAAAKEIRIFELADWLGRGYVRTSLATSAPVAARRREVYFKPYLLYTTVGLAITTSVTVVLARGALAGNISLAELVVGIQSVIAAVLLGGFYPESDVQTQFGMQAVEALDEVRGRLARAPTPARAQSPARTIELTIPSLRLTGVSFGYPGAERAVLDGVDLRIPPGKCTAIVGVNGAGKSTLVKLLTRLYEPTAGAIFAGDTDIAGVDPSTWRRLISVVFQDFIHYELSASDNIAFGAAHIPRDRNALEWAAKRAGIWEHFRELPLGLDTPLARSYSGGTELSGGQWQRIAIARSLYALRAGARFLILDEPTAALDVRAEAAFFDQFVELTAGATSVLISHRLSSVRRADLIAVIDGGRVVEQGSHAELMGIDGYYARLFRLQAERFANETVTERQPLEAVAGAFADVGNVRSMEVAS